MKEKYTETAEPSSWELMNPRQTAMEPPWDPTRTSVCGGQLFSLIYLRGHWQWDQDIPLVHEQACWSPFPIVGYPAQP